MHNRNRVRPTPLLSLALLIGTATAAPALPGGSVAETALQAALSAPASAVQAAAEVAQPSLATSAQRSPVVPPRAAQAALAPTAPASAPKAVTQATQAAPVKPAQPTKQPVKAAAPAKPVQAATPVVKTAAKPAPSPEELRQRAIAQAQQAARRNARSVVAHSTAYNSFAAQTDASPTITATGTRVRFGVVALSRDLLRQFPYGSKVMIEDLSGRYATMLAGKVFVVEDTMHPRMYNTVDVWMPTRGQAMAWGARNVRITAVR